MKKILINLICIILPFIFILSSCYFDNGKDDDSLIESSSQYDYYVDKLPYTSLKFKYLDIKFPTVNGDEIYMAVAPESTREEVGCKFLVKYNMKTKETDTIFESPYKTSNIHNIQIEGNYVVWSDLEIWGTECDIYCFNIDTGETIQIDRFSCEAASFTIPVLSNGKVFWIKEEGIENGKIYGTVYRYDIRTGKIKSLDKLNEIYLYNLQIKSNDGMVTWAERIRENQWKFTVLDSESEKSDTFVVNGEYCYEPIYHNGFLLFSYSKDYFLTYSKISMRNLNIKTGEITEAHISNGCPILFDDYAVAQVGSVVCFYKRNADDFVSLGNISDYNVDNIWVNDKKVAVVLQNASYGTANELVNETEILIFDFVNT